MLPWHSHPRGLRVTLPPMKSPPKTDLIYSRFLEKVGLPTWLLSCRVASPAQRSDVKPRGPSSSVPPKIIRSRRSDHGVTYTSPRSTLLVTPVFIPPSELEGETGRPAGTTPTQLLHFSRTTRHHPPLTRHFIFRHQTGVRVGEGGDCGTRVERFRIPLPPEPESLTGGCSTRSQLA